MYLLSLRRFELLQVPHQETILPLNQRLGTLITLFLYLSFLSLFGYYYHYFYFCLEALCFLLSVLNLVVELQIFKYRFLNTDCCNTQFLNTDWDSLFARVWFWFWFWLFQDLWNCCCCCKTYACKTCYLLVSVLIKT